MWKPSSSAAASTPAAAPRSARLAAEFLTRLQVDRVFLGVNGVHPDAGWTVVDFDAAQVKRAMLSRAREVVVVADGSKLGAAAFASIGPLSLAHALITDIRSRRPSGSESLAAAGVEVVIASVRYNLCTIALRLRRVLLSVNVGDEEVIDATPPFLSLCLDGRDSLRP